MDHISIFKPIYVEKGKVLNYVTHLKECGID